MDVTVTDGVLGNQQCTLAVRGLDRRKRKLHETHASDRAVLGRDDLKRGHGLAAPQAASHAGGGLGQGREKVSEQRVSSEAGRKLRIIR